MEAGRSHPVMSRLFIFPAPSALDLSAVPATEAASCGGCKVDACQQELNHNHRFISQRLLKQPSAGNHFREPPGTYGAKTFPDIDFFLSMGIQSMGRYYSDLVTSPIATGLT